MVVAASHTKRNYHMVLKISTKAWTQHDHVVCGPELISGMRVQSPFSSVIVGFTYSVTLIVGDFR
jgi:hypothetical protein